MTITRNKIFLLLALLFSAVWCFAAPCNIPDGDGGYDFIEPEIKGDEYIGVTNRATYNCTPTDADKYAWSVSGKRIEIDGANDGQSVTVRASETPSQTIDDQTLKCEITYTDEGQSCSAEYDVTVCDLKVTFDSTKEISCGKSINCKAEIVPNMDYTVLWSIDVAGSATAYKDAEISDIYSKSPDITLYTYDPFPSEWELKCTWTHPGGSGPEKIINLITTLPDPMGEINDNADWSCGFPLEINGYYYYDINLLDAVNSCNQTPGEAVFVDENSIFYGKVWLHEKVHIEDVNSDGACYDLNELKSYMKRYGVFTPMSGYTSRNALYINAEFGFVKYYNGPYWESLENTAFSLSDMVLPKFAGQSEGM